MYVYKPTGQGNLAVYEVGFYDPEGEWHQEGCYAEKVRAAARVNYLNGGNKDFPAQENYELLNEAIDSYFKNLIAIPYPKATCESLKEHIFLKLNQ